MKHGPRYLLLGLLAFALFLPLLAPATLVTEGLSRRVAGFSAQAAEGTALFGAARGVRWRGLRIERLEWRWRPSALLTGWLEFRLTADDPEAPWTARVAVNPARRLRWRDASGQAPLSRLGVLPQLARLPVQGLLEFKLQEGFLDSAARPQSARGVVTLRDLRVTLGQAVRLGDFTLQLTPAQPAGIQGAVQDQGGPLALEGGLELQPDGRYRFTGHAAARDASAQPLRQALQWLGPPGGDGRWPLNFSGVLPW